MKRKYECTYIYPFEYVQLQEHINEMAEQGWQIDRMRGSYLRYHYAQEHHHYEVLLMKQYHRSNPAIEDQNTQKLKELIEDFDCQHVTSYGPFQIIETKSDQPITTDQALAQQEMNFIVKRYSKPYNGWFLMIIFLTVFLSVFPIFSLEHQLSFFLDTFQMLLFLVLFVSFFSIIYLRLPYYQRKKKQYSPFSMTRKLLYPLPVILGGCLLLEKQAYGAMIFYTIIPCMASLSRRYPKKENLIGILSTIVMLLFLWAGGMAISPNESPTDDIATQMSIAYDEYSKRSSPFGEEEMYHYEEHIVLVHYQTKQAFTTSLLQEYIMDTLQTNQFPTTAILLNDRTIFPLSDTDVWIYYRPCSEEEIQHFLSLFPRE